jgi:signal transduction histidine kinase
VSFSGGTVFAFRDISEQYAIEQLRSDFVSTVSHELRTPLAAIYGAALTLQRNDVRLEDSQRTGLLDVISGEADRLARIVNDILWASRLDSGQMGITIERCDAQALTTQVAEALRTHAPAGIFLDVDAEPELPAVAADPDKLRQVLTNLIDNAVKYSPAGVPVEVRVMPQNGVVDVTVADRGPGIAAEDQRLIFEKFGRVSTGASKPGTGLGLYIARSIAEAHGGTLDVASAPGRGATFTLRLPVG